MSDTTAIEWTNHTWNPTRGCRPVSPGCLNCYAMLKAARFSGPGLPFEGFAKFVDGKPRWTNHVELIEPKLLEPLRRRIWRGSRVFVDSMSDLFHENLPVEDITAVFAVMMLCPEVTFQVLTKRTHRMSALVSRPGFRSDVMAAAQTIAFDCDSMPGHPKTPEGCGYHDQKFFIPTYAWPLPNVWLGVSVEDQKTADERRRFLLDTPAAVRFVSYEPALGPVDFTPWLRDGIPTLEQMQGPNGAHFIRHGASRLDWIIAGGESGPDARPAHPDWFRDVRDQSAAAGVPFFFKQWGEWAPVNSGATSEGPRNVCLKKVTDGEYRAFTGNRNYHTLRRVSKKAAGRLFDGREHNEFPEAR